MDHAVTATQKSILKAFGMTEKDVEEQALETSKLLAHLPKNIMQQDDPGNLQCPQGMDIEDISGIDS